MEKVEYHLGREDRKGKARANQLSDDARNITGIEEFDDLSITTIVTQELVPGRASKIEIYDTGKMLRQRSLGWISIPAKPDPSSIYKAEDLLALTPELPWTVTNVLNDDESAPKVSTTFDRNRFISVVNYPEPVTVKEVLGPVSDLPAVILKEWEANKVHVTNATVLEPADRTNFLGVRTVEYRDTETGRVILSIKYEEGRRTNKMIGVKFDNDGTPIKTVKISDDNQIMEISERFMESLENAIGSESMYRELKEISSERSSTSIKSAASLANYLSEHHITQNTDYRL